jgi:hypothetical protein
MLWLNRFVLTVHHFFARLQIFLTISLATLDELAGNVSHTTNTKTLAHELGYSIH